MAALRSLLLPAIAVLIGAALLSAYIVVARDPVPTGSTVARTLLTGEPPLEEAAALPPGTAQENAGDIRPDSQAAAAAPRPSERSAVEGGPEAPEPRIELAQAQQLPTEAVQVASSTRPAAPPPQAPAPRPAAGAPTPAAPAPGSPGAPAGQQQQQGAAARQPAQIDRNNLLFLVRSTLLALHQANETGNYSVLREMSAPGFQTANNLARLSEIFANLRAQKLDLSAVSILEPQLTSTPSIDANNLLLIEGAYPQIPPSVAFRLLFQPVDGRWRLQGISLNLGQAGAAQQQAAPAQGTPAPAPTEPAAPAGAQAPANRPPAQAPANRPNAGRPAGQ